MADKAATTPKENKPKEKRKRGKGLAITLLILKWIRVPFLCLVALAVGLWLGYAKLGKQPVADMWQLDTWKHLYDLVFAQ
ncbi:DNA-directed RNA polymerase subunit beta [compost metagenome]